MLSFKYPTAPVCLNCKLAKTELITYKNFMGALCVVAHSIRIRHRERASSSPDSSHFLGLHLESPHKTTSSSCGGGCASVWPHRKYAHRENTLAGTGKYLGWHGENTDVGKTLMNLATLDTYTIGA